MRKVDAGVAGPGAARERSRITADRIDLQRDGGADGSIGASCSQTYRGKCTSPAKRYKVIEWS